jgi:hypothetical protein
MGKTEKLQKALEKQGGLFEDSGIPETKEVQVQGKPGQIPLPQWGIPPTEEKAIERILSLQAKGQMVYYQIGKNLLWLKENCVEPGEWVDYLRNRIDLEERTAYRFMAFAKRADEQGYLPRTLVERKTLPGKGKKGLTKVSNSGKAHQEPSRAVSELETEIKTLKFQAKEAEKKAESERKAREKAEKLAKEAEERFERERPKARTEKPPKPETTTDSFIVELAPGFKREEVNKGLISWFWRSQGKVKSGRKQVIIHLDIKV